MKNINKNINKNIIALGFVSFFTDMATAMVTPLIPILVVHILHNDIQALSQIVALATFISYAFRIVFGYLADKYQLNKLFIVIGYTISALAKPLYYFVSSWQNIAILQSSERLGKAVRSASKDSMISAYANKNQSGKAFGFHKMMDIAGELFGAILIFVVLYFYGEAESMIRLIFVATIVPGFIAVILVFYFVEDAPSATVNRQYHWQSSDMQLLPIIGLYFLSVFFIFNSSFYVIVAADLGYQIMFIPVFFIVLNLTQTLTSYHIGIKIDQIGSSNMLLLSFIFGLLTLALMYFSFIWFAFIFLGLYSVTSLNAMRSYISHHAHNKTTLFGIFYGGTAIFSSLGALLTGFVWNNYNHKIAIIISIIGICFLVIALVFLNKDYKKTINSL